MACITTQGYLLKTPSMKTQNWKQPSSWWSCKCTCYLPVVKLLPCWNYTDSRRRSIYVMTLGLMKLSYINYNVLNIKQQMGYLLVYATKLCFVWHWCKEWRHCKAALAAELISVRETSLIMKNIPHHNTHQAAEAWIVRGHFKFFRSMYVCSNSRDWQMIPRDKRVRK